MSKWRKSIRILIHIYKAIHKQKPMLMSKMIEPKERAVNMLGYFNRCSIFDQFNNPSQINKLCSPRITKI